MKPSIQTWGPARLFGQHNAITNGQSAALDWTRAIAAQVVLLVHMCEWFYVPFSNRTDFTWITSFGSLAVAIFFVLSGALICNSISKQLCEAKFSWPRYLRARIARIYPTLLAALAITTLCYALIRGFGMQGYPRYDEGIFPGNITRESAQIKLSTIAATGLFLNGMIGIPGVNVGTVSMNGPLWSLAHEFWFYVTAGLFATYLQRRDPRFLFPPAFFILWQTLAGNWKWLVGLAVWFLGAVVISRPVKTSAISTLPSLVLTLGVGYILGIVISNRSLEFGLQGALAASFIYLMLARTRTANLSTISAARMAGFSYTLYAIHWPLIQLVFAAAGKWLLDVSWPTHFLFCVTLAVFINFLSYKISQFTENTILWRDLLERATSARR